MVLKHYNPYLEILGSRVTKPKYMCLVLKCQFELKLDRTRKELESRNVLNHFSTCCICIPRLVLNSPAMIRISYHFHMLVGMMFYLFWSHRHGLESVKIIWSKHKSYIKFLIEKPKKFISILWDLVFVVVVEIKDNIGSPSRIKHYY
jgi:hypothetical protein